jgi:hypothetical protein
VSTESADAQGAAAAPSAWEVQEASIGRSLNFVGELADVTAPGPLANVDGMITNVFVDGAAPVGIGAPLFAVDLRTVVAGQGTVPAFRDLRAGDTGADVAQLRAFLCSLNHLRECTGGTTFTSAMTRAVDNWQKERGVVRDGVVKSSDIMWFPSLPATMRPATDVAVGQRLTASTRPLLVVSGAPTLKIRATRDQAALVPAGAVVRAGSRTQGVVGAVTAAPVAAEGDQAAADAVDIEVLTADGTAGVCSASDECRELLGSGSSARVDVVIEVVPAQTGTGVPVRAIMSDADDTTYVRDEAGRKRPVQVLGSSGGMALVDGVELGERILVSSEDDG